MESNPAAARGAVRFRGVQLNPPHTVSGMVANFQAATAAAYVAFSGAYWLPGVSPSMMAMAKLAAFGSLALLGASSIGRTDRNTWFFYFGLALCAALAFVTGALNEGVASGFESFRNYAEPLVWLLAMNGMNPRACRQFVALLKVFLPIASLLIIYVILAYFGLLPDLATPAELLTANPLYSGSTVSNSGFTGSRTGVGVVVSVSAILTAVLFIEGKRRWSPATFFAVAIVAAGLLCSMVAGARGGAFALVAAVGLGVMSGRRSRYTNIMIVAGLVGLLLYFGAFSIVPDLFFRNLDATGSIAERLDALSTGRISSYWQGLKHWVSSPFIGVGPTNALVWVNQGEQLPVHNVWLRVLAESGLIVAIPVFWVTARMLGLSRNRPVPADVGDPGAFRPPANIHLVVICGLILALIEPAVLFGSFNSNVPIWTAVWMLFKRDALLASAGESAGGGRPAPLVGRRMRRV